MSCEIALKINSYVDGELDDAQAAAVRQHLEECDACNRYHRYFLALRSSLRNGSFYHRTPLELKMRIKSLWQTDAEKEAAKRLIGLPW